MTELETALFAASPNGPRRFSDDELRHAVPFMVLAVGATPSACTPPVQQALAEMLVAAGVRADMTADDVQGRVEAYYANAPINPALVETFWAALAQMAGRARDRRRRAVEAFLGSTPNGDARSDAGSGFSLLAIRLTQR